MSSGPWGVKTSLPNAHFLNPIPQHLRALVVDYLFQNCYGDTARTLLNDSGVRQLDADGDEIMSEPTAPSPDPLSLPPEAVRSLALRREIRRNILSGRVEHAMDLITQHFPSVLTPAPSSHSSSSPPPPDTTQFLYARSLEPHHISLNLRIQAFIEAMRTSPLPGDPPPTPALTDSDTDKVQLVHSARKLNIAVQALPDQEDLKQYAKELEHVMSLLAYTVPENSPAARYMSPERREAVADQVNSAILHRTGYRSTSSVELSARYTTVLWSFLHDLKVKPPPESSRPAGVRLPPNDTSGPVPNKATDKDSDIVPVFDLQQFLTSRTS
ncbi:hypothetical protein NEOLEDRAFT_1177475 [Neolentinus lepideus HHB14362 ss-1]|uniref:CRA domain-containing protein n=1 Tax=Neolentinus lepideus HHB14362 ss-1 TaxID=1314782 RepID=A0A165TCP1_9AGAM|nr:hypothetical protein NEOLEDRAFT_1177475 [Neolentinus lepideus HHB14362 ss-1]